ncbi:MAG: dolichyl-phosphate beta-glucosyltransferase [Candidatus Solibacter sp.]
MRRSLSIIIPAYNEAKRLPASLVKVREYLGASHWEFAEIVVVDDGSADDTVQVARDAGVRVLQNPGNRGKGYSVKHGMLAAKGEWALFTDADLSSPIGEVEKLWTAAERASAQIAVGSRAVDRSLVGVHQPVLREAVGRVFNAAMRLVTGLPYKDTQCGFKLFRTSAAREVFSLQQLDGFGFDVEVLFIAKRLGLRSVEVSVRWDNVEGTKVSLLLGFAAFLDLLKVRRNALQGKYKVVA